MNIYKITLITILIIFSIIWLYGFFKTKNPIKCFIRSGIIGMISLIAVAFISNFTRLYIGVNLASFITSAVLGLPGVILMVVINLL